MEKETIFDFLPENLWFAKSKHSIHQKMLIIIKNNICLHEIGLLLVFFCLCSLLLRPVHLFTASSVIKLASPVSDAVSLHQMFPAEFSLQSSFEPSPAARSNCIVLESWSEN